MRVLPPGGLANLSKDPTPSIIPIPGSKRQTARRHAQNPPTSATAFVVPDKANDKSCAIKCAVKRKGRVLGLILKGHNEDIVDIEFLQTDADASIFVLGSCDKEGVVFLWFIYIAKDALGIDIDLRLLKKYSLFSLRKSLTAFYSRIRLAGTVESGTMVLVPNDGSNCRVVTFRCEPTQLDSGEGAIAIEATPDTPRQLPAPETTEGGRENEVDSSEGNTVPIVAAAAAGTAAVGAAVVGTAAAVSNPADPDSTQKEVVTAEGKLEYESNVHTIHSESYASTDIRASSMMEDAESEGQFFDASTHITSPVNSTFPMSRAEGEDVEVEDDLAQTTARAAGISLEDEVDEDDYGADVEIEDEEEDEVEEEEAEEVEVDESEEYKRPEDPEPGVQDATGNGDVREYDGGYGTGYSTGYGTAQ